MVEKSIIKKVKKYLSVVRQNGVPVSFGVIFGSRVTGKSNQWSDIDLVVVSPLFDKKRERGDIDLLWRLTVRTDNRIEPIPCGTFQWENDDSSTLIEAARRQGAKVSL